MDETTELTVAGLQAELFDKFNAEGSMFTARGTSATGLVDTWEVLRVVPHAAKSKGVDFWVVWRQPGFLGLPAPDGDGQGMMQYVHVTHFVAFEKTDDNLLLTQRDGRILEVDFLFRPSDRAEWDEFRAEKARYKDLYDSYYESSADDIARSANY